MMQKIYELKNEVPFYLACREVVNNGDCFCSQTCFYFTNLPGPHFYVNTTLVIIKLHFFFDLPKHNPLQLLCLNYSTSVELAVFPS